MLSPARLTAAKSLTTLLTSSPSFSLVRIGDGDVEWALATLDGKACKRYQYDDTGSIEHVRGVVGLLPEHFPRFKSALEQASYLDRCDSIDFVRQHLPDLGLDRPPHLATNSSPETSNILFEWTMFELDAVLSSHTCLIAGAEAALLDALWDDPDYRAAASDVLTFQRRPHFHQIRDNGRHYAENLDLIKADLTAEVQRTGADTLFLSLATGAKVLVHELANELGIRAIDFGSMTRGLCYAGSSGYQSHRDMHHPFFFRVPYPTVIAALQQAHPDLPLYDLVGKAHAQLALELHPHHHFTFNTSDGLGAQDRVDRSPENLRAFRHAYRHYRKNLRPSALSDPAAKTLDQLFHLWLWKKGLGLRGKLFRLAVRTKSLLRRILPT
jgi:hypothetical protein